MSVLTEDTQIENSRSSYRVKVLFMILLDGINNETEPLVKGIDSYYLGVCRLSYDVFNNILHVYLRKPGLLIGKSGTVIEKFERKMKMTIQVHEVDLLTY